MSSSPLSKPDRPVRTAIGLMSGTSMDGIDVALIRSDGETVLERGAFAAYPYQPAFRRRLAEGLKEAASITARGERPGGLRGLEDELTRLHGEAVRHFLAAGHFAAENVDLIGFHGQTVLHRPERRLTVQLGDAAALAAMTGIDVVADMRANDLENGGQGAPLVPIYHAALAHKLPEAYASLSPIAFVNIGGIANLTWIDPERDEETMIAFDTGPGNALIDQWVESQAGIPYDQDGAMAAEGGVIATIADRYLAESFFEKKAPKSLDRNDFAPLPSDAAELADGARTLAHVTAAAIVRAVEHLPAPPKLWVLSGGGRKNPAIRADMEALTAGEGARIITAEAAGFDGDAMEAEAWAYLAVRSAAGLPLTFPKTTGCKAATTGGIRFSAGRRPLSNTG